MRQKFTMVLQRGPVFEALAADSASKGKELSHDFKGKRENANIEVTESPIRHRACPISFYYCVQKMAFLGKVGLEDACPANRPRHSRM